MRKLGVLAIAFLSLATVDPTVADGWYTGKVEIVNLSNRGSINIYLDPAPSEQEFSCGGCWASVAASEFISDSALALHINQRLHESLLGAALRDARVQLYLVESFSSDGEAECDATVVQVQRVRNESSGSTSSGTGSGSESSSQPVSARQYFGALAVGDRGGYGINWNWSTQAAADTDALNRCRRHSTNCRIVGRYGSGQCAALAQSTDTGAFGYAGGSTRDAAINESIRQCQVRAPGSQCVVRAHACNSAPQASGDSLFESDGVIDKVLMPKD